MEGRWVKMFLACGCLAWQVAAADEMACLTGNAPVGRNISLSNACYRFVWAGTTQPRIMGLHTQWDWVPFSSGALTDRSKSAIVIYSPTVKLAGYHEKTFDIPNDYEIEVDLGQVCRISKFELLHGPKATMDFKLYVAAAKRWLPIGQGKNSLEFKDLAVQRFRITVNGESIFQEMYIWGAPLGPQARENYPPPLVPPASAFAYKPLQLKPTPAAGVTQDPFVFPEPQEMRLQKERVSFPKQVTIVVPATSDQALRDAAEYFGRLLSRLADVDVTITTNASSPAIWLGMAEHAGPWQELAGRLKLGRDQMEAEGYGLEVTDGRVLLVGRDLEGLIWSTKTLMFLVQPEPSGGISVPKGTIRDFPRCDFRPVFGYPGWRGEFKAGLLEAMAMLKNNIVFLKLDEQCRNIVRSNHMRHVIEGPLFPGSICGADDDLLEIAQGQRRHNLNQFRLSACCSHPDYWPLTLQKYPQEPSNPPGLFVDVSLDEMMHNPWMVCPRCRSRGLTQREMLYDAFMKAYRFLIKRGYKVLAYATGFGRGDAESQFRAFDMYLDIPTQNVIIVNYKREEENKILHDRGLMVVPGGLHLVNVKSNSPYIAGIVWNWGSGERSEMMNVPVPQMLMQAEINWSSFASKVGIGLPEREARMNRIMEFALHVIDSDPLEIPGSKHTYFPVDISAQADRTLRDDVYGDGQGWLDRGPAHDLRHLPTGRQVFNGIPYDITEKAIIVAGPGNVDGGYPDQVSGIPVGKKVQGLSFLHTCKRRVYSNYAYEVLLLGFYRIRYDDGSFLTIPINYGQHLLEWDQKFGYAEMEFAPVNEPAGDARVAWRGLTDGGDDITLYAIPWRNPYPEKAVRSVDVLASAQMESNDNGLCLLAISGRELEERDVRIAQRLPTRPALREYRSRPALPGGVTALDLTRNTAPTHIAQQNPQKCSTFVTEDRWFSAVVSGVVGAKYEMNYGAYSALNPDDNPWRCFYEKDSRSGKGALEISFKDPIPLRGIGVKGIMQIVSHSGLFPVDFNVYVRNAQNKWNLVGEIKEHVGQEGEERWVFPEERNVSGIKVNITAGAGLSAVALYAREGILPKAKQARGPGMSDSLNKKEATEDEVMNLLKGL